MYHKKRYICYEKNLITMEKNFDYSQVPHTFMHCIHTPCVQKNDCVRYQLMQHVTAERVSLLIVNPAHLSDVRENCPHFFADQTAQFALGITHLLDNIPHKKAMQIRSELYSSFGKNTYYRIRKKERLIRPDEQNYIRQLFVRKGISEEPVFDKYVEQYEW